MGGQGSSLEASGRGRHWESTQRLSSLDPCPGRCLPAAPPGTPCRPCALRAQDQAADPEAEAPSPEDALPAERGPQAALGPQPAPRPGAAAGRLRPGHARQEGQDEEENVTEMTQPPAPHVLQLCRYVPGPVQGVWGAPCRAVAHEKECCMATEGQQLSLLETGTFEQGFEGCIGVCALNWQLGPCCFHVPWVQRRWSHRSEP